MKKSHKNIPIFVPHKGCPHDCSFCNQKKITGVTEELRVEQAEAIIQSALKTIDHKNAFVEVAFFGGSFTGIPLEKQRELLTLAHKYKKNNQIDGIRLSTRPDYIDDGILSMLKDYGVTTIELGVQSMDDEVLKASIRGHSKEDTINAARLIRAYHFDLGLQMMVGLPKDSREKTIKTARQIIALAPDCVRIYPTLVIENTLLSALYRGGHYTPLSVEEAVDICKELLLMFEENHIEVIRLGLMSSEQINMEHSVIAGPYHAAFGELVQSEILYDRIIRQIGELVNRASVTVSVHPKHISKLTGNQRRIIRKIQQQFPQIRLNVMQNENLGEKEIIVAESKQKGTEDICT